MWPLVRRAGVVPAGLISYQRTCEKMPFRIVCWVHSEKALERRGFLASTALVGRASSVSISWLTPGCRALAGKV